MHSLPRGLYSLLLIGHGPRSTASSCPIYPRRCELLTFLGQRWYTLNGEIIGYCARGDGEGSPSRREIGSIRKSTRNIRFVSRQIVRILKKERERIRDSVYVSRRYNLLSLKPWIIPIIQVTSRESYVLVKVSSSSMNEIHYGAVSLGDIYTYLYSIV